MAVARLARVWGNRGALSGVPLGRDAGGYRPQQRVFAHGARGAPGQVVSLEIESVREQRGRLIFKFRGVDSIAQADALAGAEIRVPLAERRPPAPDEFYHSDVVGCQVVEEKSGQPLGVVTGWQEIGGTPLLEVDTGAPGQPLLVPFARSICREIDLAGRRIVVDLPEGLKELNG